jgi:Ribosomal protein L4/L1 family
MRRDILHKAVVFEANAARGTGGHTKTRAEVKGSTRKIRQQKGTGMARVGSRVAAGRRGGNTPSYLVFEVLTGQRRNNVWSPEKIVCDKDSKEGLRTSLPHRHKLAIPQRPTDDDPPAIPRGRQNAVPPRAAA